MRVNPACSMPFYNKNSKLILVNLQITPYDKKSEVRSFSKTDKFMMLLMKHLDLKEFDKKFDILQELKKEKELSEKLEKISIEMKKNEEIESKKESIIEIQELNTKTEPRFLSTTAFVKDKNDKKKIIVIGGLGLNKSNNRYPTIETLEEKKGWLENKNINKDEEIPYLTKPRWGHSCSVVDNKIYLIGGFDHQSMYNDVNIYDFENEKIININDTNKKILT